MSTGDHFMRMDAVSGQLAPLLDQAALAAALNSLLALTERPLAAADLPIKSLRLAAYGRYRFSVRDIQVFCDADAHCSKVYAKDKSEPGILSPDKKSEAFVRDWNLWLRDLASGKETQLTTDGVQDFGYATDNAGWKHSDKAILE